MVSLPDENDVVNAFQIFSDQKAFVVQAASAQEKTMWIENITLCVNKLISQDAPDQNIEWAVLIPPSGSVTACPLCQTPFSFTSRRKTCRKCGSHVCGACSQNTVIIPHLSFRKPQRVCRLCYQDLALWEGRKAMAGTAHGGGSAKAKERRKFGPRRSFDDLFSDLLDEGREEKLKTARRTDKYEKYHRTWRIHGI